MADLWAQMRADYLEGNLSQAEKIGDQILKEHPRHVQALHLLSVIANRTNRKELELSLLRKVLAIDPAHSAALVGTANIIRAKGRTEEAVNLCRRALERQPFYANAYNAMGLCRMSQKRPGDAAKCFNMAVAFQPNLTAAQQNFSAALRRLGITSEADRDRALAPNTPEEFEVLGWLMVFRRKRLEAIEMFEKGLKLDPSSTRLLIALADQKRQHGDSKESIQLWKTVIAKGASAQAYSGLGYAYQDLGHFELATDAFRESLALKPVQGDAHLGIATCRKFSPGEEPVIVEMNRLCTDPSLRPMEKVLLHTALSKGEDDLGNYESAVRHMDEANRIAQIEGAQAQIFASKWFSQRFDDNKSTFTGAFLESIKETGLLSERPVFIVGLPRSGTTLAEQILSRHPKIAAGGELPYWSDQESLVEGGLANAIHDRELREGITQKFLAELEAIGSAEARVTDKMPDNFAHLGFLHAMLPNARFIHCRRNPLDNCVSIYMTPFRNRPPMALRREDIVEYYRLYRDLMSHWQKVIPKNRLLDLDYEDVVNDRERAMRRVIEFLGLEWDPACLAHEVSLRSVNTPSNWQSRQPIYSSSIERWRRYEPWLGALEVLKTKT
jgi:tetratricopeptide (TPR) repeat protein